MITFRQFNRLVDEAHENAVKHGFYDDAELMTSAIQQRQMLIVCEIAEAMEADRKKRWLKQNETLFSELKAIVDGKENCADFDEYYSLFVKGFAEEEIADICIRCFDLFGFMQSKVKDFGRGGVSSRYLTRSVMRMPFWKLCYTLTRAIVPDSDLLWIDIHTVVCYCFGWCDEHNIDLLTHIKAKMMYNANRPYKHGKAY